jgi:protease I
MKALIMIGEGFEDSEFFYPYYRLQEEGVDVDVASSSTGSLTGKHGYTFEANITFDDVKPEQYDLLVIPGGKGPERIRTDERSVAIVKSMAEAGKTIASICHGAQMLISAGVLDGRRCTCYSGIRDDVKAAGADYSDSEVVVDGNLVSSRHPGDLPAFMTQTLKAVRVPA